MFFLHTTFEERKCKRKNYLIGGKKDLPSQSKIRNFDRTFSVQQDVGWFLITVNNITSMQISCCTQQLIHDEPFVNVFKDSRAPMYGSLQICIHILEDQVQISIVICSMDIE